MRPLTAVRRAGAVRVALLCAATALPAAAAPTSVLEVPVLFEHAAIRRELLLGYFTGPDERWPVWDDGTGCNALVLRAPRVAEEGGRLRIRAEVEAKAGAALGGFCVPPLAYTGTLELLEEVSAEPTRPVLHFRVVDSRLADETGDPGIAGTVWDWVKTEVHPRLERRTVSFEGTLAEIRGLLPLVVADPDAAWTDALVASLRIGRVEVVAAGLRTELHLDVPQRAGWSGSEPGAAAAPLTAEELARFEAGLDEWDAFLTFAATRLFRAAPDAEGLRVVLAEVLLESRYELVAALRDAPTGPPAEDPVRRLFLEAWPRLAPAVRDAASDADRDTLFRYLSFLAAGDALDGLDRLGGAGLDVSAPGLRRLARLLDPGAPGDPLAYERGVDPEVRRLLGFGPPLPAPEAQTAPDAWTTWLRRLGPPLAHAAAPGPDAVELRRLRRWVPSRDELPDYLGLVRKLLVASGDAARAPGRLPSAVEPVYRHALLATAWQESCWRQYVARDGRIEPLRSPVGAVGLLQIHLKVWRGVYDPNGLLEDPAYNARAGAEILFHYFADHAVKKGEHEVRGDPDDVARAAYAVYNGGPRHLRRYREPGTKPALRKIDDLFLERYRAVQAGRELAVAECF